MQFFMMISIYILNLSIIQDYQQFLECVYLTLNTLTPKVAILSDLPDLTEMLILCERLVNVHLIIWAMSVSITCGTLN